MVVQPIELKRKMNRLHKLKCKVFLISGDIRFLKSCLKEKVYPSFMKLKVSLSNNITDKVIINAKNNWIKLEINKHYAKKNRLELEAYQLHLDVAKSLDTQNIEWFDQEFNKMVEVIEHKYKKKVLKQDKKLDRLVGIPKNSKGVTMASTCNDVGAFNFSQTLVNNQSDVVFSNEEMQILNKGLKFGICNFVSDHNELLVNLESGIKWLECDTKNAIRAEVGNVVMKAKKTGIDPTQKAINRKQNSIIRGLREKDVFYVKADKGNALVVLNKDDYYNRMERLLVDNIYEQVNRNPLLGFAKEVKVILKDCNFLINEELRVELVVSNPVLPRLYGLPKLHKTGDAMRPIVSGINAPTYKISKWLVREFSKLIEPFSMAVKNNYEFIEEIKDELINEDERLISFDVAALFPSIPLEETFKYLEVWLEDNELEERAIRDFMVLTKLCMKQNVFGFNKKFFRQKDGTAMGNPLSGFLANIFMSEFEVQAQRSIESFPRIWFRYVDDVFAVIKKDADILSLVDDLNSLNVNINFTFEKEDNNELAFLDMKLRRKANCKLEIDIFRKSTHTDRFITNDSHHSLQHKRAALNTLVNRLNFFPLNESNYLKELKYIKDTAKFNGFETGTVENIQRKCLLKKANRAATTLNNVTEDTKWLKLTYCPSISNKINRILKAYGFKVAITTNKNLKGLLGSSKDPIDSFEKSGIYSLTCPCGEEYRGQTRRTFNTRIKEHLAHLRFGREGKSALADHFLHSGHDHGKISKKVLKVVTNNRELDAWESMFINKCEGNLLNYSDGPIIGGLLVHKFYR